MGTIAVGTASWTDKTLLASGWYPASADTSGRYSDYAQRNATTFLELLGDRG